MNSGEHHRSGLSTARPELLAELLTLPEPEQPGWLEREHGSLLAHQLRAPMLLLEQEAGMDSGCAGHGEGLTTLQDLLQSETPPLELLELAKGFAKANIRHPGTGLPKPVAMVLYYAVLAAASVRRQQRLTQLSDGELENGYRWCLDRPWLPPELRELLTQGVVQVQRAGE